MKVEDKTNEITAVPELLKLLIVKGAIITVDALNCQRDIAVQIKRQEADYVLAIKQNKKELYKKIQHLFVVAEVANYQEMLYSKHEVKEENHGRIDTRCYTVLPSQYLKPSEQRWEGLQSVIKIESRREIKGGEMSIEKRYYISSLAVMQE